MKHILFLLLFLPVLAYAQFPNAPNKIRLGNQTTADGLVVRTAASPSWTPSTINNAWLAFDTVAEKLYYYDGGAWNEYTGGSVNIGNTDLTLTGNRRLNTGGYQFWIQDGTGAEVPYIFIGGDQVSFAASTTTSVYLDSSEQRAAIVAGAVIDIDADSIRIIGTQPNDNSLNRLLALDTVTNRLHYVDKASITGSGGTDTNFATDNLTFTGNRVHNLSTRTLTIADGGTYPTFQQSAATDGITLASSATDIIAQTPGLLQIENSDTITVTADRIRLNASDTRIQQVSKDNALNRLVALDSLTGRLYYVDKSSIAGGGGTVSGTGTTGTIPVWSSSSALVDSPLTVASGNVTATGTGAFRLPNGTTAERPGTPTAGMTRYNTTSGVFEYYGASAWEVPVRSASATGLGTATRIPYADAAGRLTESANLLYSTSNQLVVNGNLFSSTIAPLILSSVSTQDDGETGIEIVNRANTISARVQLLAKNTGGAAPTFLTKIRDAGGTLRTVSTLDFNNLDLTFTGTVPVDIFKITNNATNYFTLSNDKVFYKAATQIGSGDFVSIRNDSIGIVQNSLGQFSAYSLKALSGQYNAIASVLSGESFARIALGYDASKNPFFGFGSGSAASDMFVARDGADLKIVFSTTQEKYRFTPTALGILTAAPQRTLHVTGTERVTASVDTATVIALIGTSVLGDRRWITVGSGLSLTSGTLSATGGAGTVTSVGITAPAAGITVSGSPITSSGSMTLALADDLAAVEGLSASGIATRTASNTWAARTITAGSGITVTNGDGVSGNPTISRTYSLTQITISGGSTFFGTTPERPDNDTPGSTTTSAVGSDFGVSGSTLDYTGASGALLRVEGSVSFSVADGGDYYLSIFKEGTEIAATSTRITCVAGNYYTIALPATTTTGSTNDTFDLRIATVSGNSTTTMHRYGFIIERIY